MIEQYVRVCLAMIIGVINKYEQEFSNFAHICLLTGLRKS